MTTIVMTTQKQVKAGKVTYKTEETDTKEITREQYRNITEDDTLKWFRRLGGSETATKGYTCDGYKTIKLISTSPNKEQRTVREFNFIYKD